MNLDEQIDKLIASEVAASRSTTSSLHPDLLKGEAATNQRPLFASSPRLQLLFAGSRAGVSTLDAVKAHREQNAHCQYTESERAMIELEYEYAASNTLSIMAYENARNRWDCHLAALGREEQAARDRLARVHDEVSQEQLRRQEAIQLSGRLADINRRAVAMHETAAAAERASR
ncbi:hypothetical protein GQ42DRAFT_22040 [Ramicandelaber brevisporus]|nr:hypothetical protein GQ42DRAFT_22040 [Ramicandelaber brevisporus]